MHRSYLAILAALIFGSTAAAQPPQPSAPPQTPYFVEFRVADMGVYGHSYIAYGRLSGNGKPANVQYADFHPDGGNVGLAVGHVVPVAAGMTPDPEVLKLPLNASWRLPITATQYRTLTAAVSAARADPKVWSALAYNCNSFVGDMAEVIGLKAPSSLLFANAYIPALRALNETPRTRGWRTRSRHANRRRAGECRRTSRRNSITACRARAIARPRRMSVTRFVPPRRTYPPRSRDRHSPRRADTSPRDL